MILVEVLGVFKVGMMVPKRSNDSDIIFRIIHYTLLVVVETHPFALKVSNKV